MEPRKPTKTEKQELIRYQANISGQELEGMGRIVESSAVAVFDDYITGGPGYSGKVMMVVWEASPSIFDVYTWKKGQIHQEEREN
jgi:hypothetical protein